MRRLTSWVVVGLGLWAAACSGGTSYRCPHCNIVLISLDTLRADHVGAYGYPRDTTPNIDALAEHGVLFENAISQSSWTRPAHLSMFTGLHPVEHGVVGLADRRRLADATPTLAGILAANGYLTAAFTGGVNVSRAFGFDQGFAEFRSNGKYFRDNLEETRYWLEQHRGEKFFLFWHGYDTHTPYPGEATDRAALGVADRPPRVGLRRVCKREDAPKRIARFVDEYDSAVRRGDRYIGKLMAELARHGLLEQTIVVFTSDHGEEFLEHRGCFHVNTLYREVLHVPLVIVAPGLPPRRVSQLVPASVSIGATILELAGVGTHDLPGPSLARALAGADPPVTEVVSETRRAIETGRGRGHVRAVTTAQEKLIHWITLARYERYDMRRDPGETVPLTAGAEVDRLTARLSTWEQRHTARQDVTREAGPASASERTRPTAAQDEIERQLRSLGYLE
jgi:arylsulfatase A-like enzyme